jgi:hypothetical protein
MSRWLATERGATAGGSTFVARNPDRGESVNCGRARQVANCDIQSVRKGRPCSTGSSKSFTSMVVGPRARDLFNRHRLYSITSSPEHRLWNVGAERLGSLESDGHLDRGRCCTGRSEGFSPRSRSGGLGRPGGRVRRSGMCPEPPMSRLFPLFPCKGEGGVAGSSSVRWPQIPAGSC